MVLAPASGSFPAIAAAWADAVSQGARAAAGSLQAAKTVWKNAFLVIVQALMGSSYKLRAVELR